MGWQHDIADTADNRQTHDLAAGARRRRAAVPEWERVGKSLD